MLERLQPRRQDADVAASAELDRAVGSHNDGGRAIQFTENLSRPGGARLILMR